MTQTIIALFLPESFQARLELKQVQGLALLFAMEALFGLVDQRIICFAMERKKTVKLHPNDESHQSCFRRSISCVGTQIRWEPVELGRK